MFFSFVRNSIEIIDNIYSLFRFLFLFFFQNINFFKFVHSRFYHFRDVPISSLYISYI